MYCKYCGVQIDNDAKFCSKCGCEQSKTTVDNDKVTTQKSDCYKKTVTALSCPKCGSIDFRVSRTSADRINHVRICVNCSNRYRTVRDVEEDIETCKKSFIVIIACAVVLLLVFIFLGSILDIGDTLSDWDWAGDDRRGSAYFFFIMVIVGYSAIIPNLVKRGKDIDNLNAEKERVSAEYYIACKKSENTAPTHCPNCDTKIYPNTHICPGCGRKL